MTGTKKGQPRSGVNADAVRIAHRRADALKLKVAGATYDAIARTLHYANPGNAWRDVHMALAAITKEPAEQLKKLELERCDEMLLAIWPSVRKGHLGAIDRALKIMERRARYEGLDAPTKQTVTIISEDIVDAEIRKLEDQLAARADAAADAEA